MASEKVLEQKKKIVEDLIEKIKKAPSGVLVDYTGITVADDTKLRADLRKSGVEYSVIKNTLLHKAFDQLGYKALDEQLNGMTAFALSDKDEIAAARILHKFASDHENFKLKGGFVDGETIDVAGVEELASIPSKEQLLCKVMGSLQSSLYSFCYAIQAIIDKSGEATAEPEAEKAAE